MMTTSRGVATSIVMALCRFDETGATYERIYDEDGDGPYREAEFPEDVLVGQDN